ncbi:hypothetical protein ACIQXF_19410 [Lysinibacillus sp. NPDC097231]|uniref:hypothetical protein n=1 Tax=Lysinibacillus sp. NPDC097231 TaxID=3364142 RepID=UPI0038141487
MSMLLLLSVAIFSGCSSDNTEDNTQEQGSGKTPIEQDTTQQDAKLIGTSEHKEVKLYEETNGVKLDFNGKVKEFNWNNPSDTGTDPQVFYTDVTGDGDKEAVIIIQTGRGTGLNNYNIHVVDKDLIELKVPDYEEIVANHIKSKVVKKDNGTLGITVKAQGKDYNFDFGFDPAPDFKQDDLGFGGVIIYFLENQTIKLHLAASVGISPTYVADFYITYKFDSNKNEFMVDQIEVKPIKN